MGGPELFLGLFQIKFLIVSVLTSSTAGWLNGSIFNNLPIIAVGMGEKEKDLHPFDAKYFSKALLG